MELYGIIKEIGRQMLPENIENKLKFTLSGEVNEVFLAYFKSNARNTILSEKPIKDTGKFSFGGEQYGDRFYGLGSGSGSVNQVIINYPIYKLIMKEKIQENIAKLKGTSCLASKAEKIEQFILFDFTANTFVFKKANGKGIIKKQFADIDKIYLQVNPEIDQLIGPGKKIDRYFVVEPAGKLCEIQKNSYLEILKLQQAGCYITDILPENVMIKFHLKHEELAMPEVKNKSLDIPFIISNIDDNVTPHAVSLTKHLPMKFFLYGSTEFTGKMKDFFGYMNEFLQKYKIIPKKGIVKDTKLPEILLDFANINNIQFSSVSYASLTNSIYTVLDNVYNAINQIVLMERILQNANLTNSLTYNLSPSGNRIERIFIAQKLVNFFLQFPIKIAFATNDPSYDTTPEKCVQFDKQNMKIIIGLKFDLLKSPHVKDSIPSNFLDILHDSIVNEMCKLEIEELKKSIEKADKDIESIMSLKIKQDEKGLFNLSYDESIGLINKVCETVFKTAYHKNMYFIFKSLTKQSSYNR